MSRLRPNFQLGVRGIVLGALLVAIVHANNRASKSASSTYDSDPITQCNGSVCQAVYSPESEMGGQPEPIPLSDSGAYEQVSYQQPDRDAYPIDNDSLQSGAYPLVIQSEPERQLITLTHEEEIPEALPTPMNSPYSESTTQCGRPAESKQLLATHQMICGDRERSPRSASKKPSTPQTCIVRDTENSKMMTLTIAGSVASSEMESPRILPAVPSVSGPTAPDQNIGDEPACGEAWNQSESSFKRRSDPLASELTVEFDRASGRIRIDASNVEVDRLLQAISSRTGKPIETSAQVAGTLSAAITGNHPDIALRRLLEPFGFVVYDHQQFLYVCAVGEPQMPVEPEIVVEAPPVVPKRSTPRAIVAEQPPVGWRGAHGAAYPAPATSEVQPAAAQMPIDRMSQVAPEALPLEPSVLVKPIGTKNTVAVHREIKIAQLAQDAFAAGRSDYAMEVLSEGVVRYPSSSLLLRLLGEAYFLRGDFRSAETALYQAVKVNKRDHFANDLLGKTLAELGQSHRAAHYLLQARSLQNASAR